MSTHIQVGIDLGTTNSEAAANRKGKVEIVKNVLGDEYTPSVFGVDKGKNHVVGKKAYDKLYKDASEDELKNNKAEVKRLMGTSEKVRFDRIKKQMTAEEISAEILKSLREDISRKFSDVDLSAAVITVPASFSTIQAEATTRAGNLAGFDHVVLVQEPIAAAVAFGFTNTQDENWLVYDLGGGTFDVAVVSSKGGVLTVLSHEGDNFLGGKDFDWLIVEKVLVPEILKQFKLTDFNRGNKKHKTTFSKLKSLAEQAKIYLSQTNSTSVDVEDVGNDEDGKEIYASVTLERKAFEEMIQPLLDKTISLTDKALTVAGIKASSIKKIVLVGAPTQIPLIKEQLKGHFEIDVDSSADPMTIVAKGAATYAIAQEIPEEKRAAKKKPTGAQAIRLHYDSLTSDTETVVAGRIDGLKGADGYTIQIQSESGLYTSAKLKLKNGKFLETVSIEPGKSNLFWVYLFDPKGKAVKLDPDSFTITHGLSVAGSPIPHSIGVAVALKDVTVGGAAEEKLDVFFKKGAVPPLSKTESYKTLKRLKKGDTENVLPVKVYEGEAEIPNRNTFVCELAIDGKKVPHDIPEGSEVDITIEVDESRALKVIALLPSIDLSFDVRATYRAEELDVEQLKQEVATQAQRFKEVEESTGDTTKSQVGGLIESVSTSVNNANLDEDEKRKANKELKQLKVTLDELTEEKKIPQLKAEFEASTKEVQGMVDSLADVNLRKTHSQLLESLKKEGLQAIKGPDKHLLVRVNEQIKDLGVRLIVTDPSFWVHHFRQLTEGGHTFTNPTDAEYYTSQGHQAVERGDLEGLKLAVRNLIALLPPEEQTEVDVRLAGITH